MTKIATLLIGRPSGHLPELGPSREHPPRQAIRLGVDTFVVEPVMPLGFPHASALIEPCGLRLAMPQAAFGGRGLEQWPQRRRGIEDASTRVLCRAMMPEVSLLAAQCLQRQMNQVSAWMLLPQPVLPRQRPTASGAGVPKAVPAKRKSACTPNTRHIGDDTSADVVRAARILMALSKKAFAAAKVQKVARPPTR